MQALLEWPAFRPSVQGQKRNQASESGQLQEWAMSLRMPAEVSGVAQARQAGPVRASRDRHRRRCNRDQVMSERGKQRYNRLKSAGLCVDCECRTRPGRTRCEKCAEEQSQRNRRRYAEKYAEIKAKRPTRSVDEWERVNRMMELAETAERLRRRIA